MKFNPAKVGAFIAALVALFAAVQASLDALPIDRAGEPAPVAAPADAGVAK